MGRIIDRLMKNIIVLGMHRSGTSMVTGLLSKLGYYVGAPEELTNTSEENPKGFFERKDVRNINDELLIGNDFDWYKVAGFTTDSLTDSSVHKYKEEISGVFNLLRKKGPFAIKEPRLCLLYLIFKEMVRDDIKLLVYRDPIESAESLLKRNKFPLHFGLALWEKYHKALFNSLSNDHLILVNYNKLLNDPKAEVQNLVNSINSLSGDDIALEQGALDFICPELYRSNKYKKYGVGYLTDSQKYIWNQLKNFDQSKTLRSPENPLMEVVLETHQELMEEYLQQKAIINSQRKDLKESKEAFAKFRKSHRLEVKFLLDSIRIFHGRHLSYKRSLIFRIKDMIRKGHLKYIDDRYEDVFSKFPEVTGERKVNQ
ncbi:hypothetical protein RCC89_02750 [Cytophagaceae bacterium ABcell3]|nr:hypothetical protein RCC89_02750 [Cytophagaceae bacterium ABcell3]